MIGNPATAEKGVIPRCVEAVFQHIAEDPSHVYTVQIGFLQLYMEML
jgi:kinesin family protein 5/centromeric protein E